MIGILLIKRTFDMPRKKVSCLNETRTMKNGMKATCIAYRMYKDIDIQFEDGTIVNTQKIHFYNGDTRNPNSQYNPHRKLEPLTMTNPELIKQWDYEKNEVAPDLITRSYKGKIWWKCDNGHSWQAVVPARTRPNATGCPYCAGQKATEGFNDFKTLNPELMLDWDYEKNQGIDPSKITAGSGTYVNWKCHFCGFEWRSRVNNRSSNKRGCPNCTMKSTSFGEQAVYYYVKKFFPDAINRYKDCRFELDIFIPIIKTAIEFDGAFFHKGEESDIREKKKYQKCKDLGIRLIRIKDSNELKNRFAADYTIGVDNLQDHNSLNGVIRFLLRDFAFKWGIANPFKNPNQIDSMVNVDKDYFDIVTNKYLREKENSFVNDHPELLEDWDYERNGNVNPQSITCGSGISVNWKCHNCGYQWKAKVNERVKRGVGCPCCNRNVLVKGVNDFATLYPEELKEWDYDNNTITPDSIIKYDTKVAWKCEKCGYQWEASIQDKVIRKDRTGCPQCAHKSIAAKRHQRAMKEGGLFDKYPELYKSWNYEKNQGIDKNDIAAGSPKRYWWKCPDCGYEWEASPNNRTRGGSVSGCPKCKYKIISKKLRNKDLENGQLLLDL